MRPLHYGVAEPVRGWYQAREKRKKKVNFVWERSFFTFKRLVIQIPK